MKRLIPNIEFKIGGSLTQPIAGRIRAPVLTLVLLNIGVLALIYVYLRPMVSDQRIDIDYALAQSAEFEKKVDDIRVEIERRRRVLADYEKLEKAGFVGEQDRLAAAELLDRLRRANRLRSLEYEMSPEEAAPIPLVRGDALQLVMTRVDLKMMAFVDTDIVAFTAAVARELPGTATIDALSVSRIAEPSRPVLTAISEGYNIDLFEATASISWRSVKLRPETDTVSVLQAGN